MFWHNFKYNFKVVIRDKNQMFWSLIFVIFMGTLFKATFGSAYEKNDLISNIKVAVYIEDERVAENFSRIIENISLDGESGEKLLDVIHADSMEEAEKILDEDETVGLFYSENGELKLMVKDTGIAESILSSVVSQYRQIVTVLTDIADESMEVQVNVMHKLMSESDSNVEKALTSGNMDAFVQYFYNLIAMSCLFASFSGVTFSINNQANLSSLGARKTLSGSNGFIQTLAGLVAEWVILSTMTIISFVYLLIIGVDFGDRIWGVVLVILIGCMLGLTLGYFIGSLGKLSANVKDAIAVSVSLIACFMSGLMIADMRMVIEQHCPLLNRINPAVLMSDSFYALNVYDTYDRFLGNVISMLAISAIFIVGGVTLGRRKQYASL